MAIVAGLVGSFIGGLLISLLAGDGLDLRPSGIIGSLVGAIIVTAVWRWWDARNKPTARPRRQAIGRPAQGEPALTRSLVTALLAAQPRPPVGVVADTLPVRTVKSEPPHQVATSGEGSP